MKRNCRAELYLDSAAGVAAGGESGEVLVKGKSAESLLLKALKHDGMEMPPSGKLPDDVIADFAKWIDLGAPDPRRRRDTGQAEARDQRRLKANNGGRSSRCRTSHLPDAQKPIDGFIRQAQQTQGLKPNHPARKEKLIRRAFFDLIGLPPTPEQVAAFVADASPQAFEKVVDELLGKSGVR